MTDETRGQIQTAVARAFAESDAARMAQLDRWIAQSQDPDFDQTGGRCIHGHPLDGVKRDSRRGTERRFCKTCNRLRMAAKGKRS